MICPEKVIDSYFDLRKRVNDVSAIIFILKYHFDIPDAVGYLSIPGMVKSPTA